MQPPRTNSVQDYSHQLRPERFTFRVYFRTFWMDYLLLALLGGLALGINVLPPPIDRVFPFYSRNGQLVSSTLSYPFKKNIIPSWLAGFLAFIVPFIFILLMQIHIKSFNDANTATMGLLYSLLSATLFQVFIKWLIGGFRPYFLSVCKTNLTASSGGTGQGFNGLFFDRSICNGAKNEIDYALETMPSGHSAIAFAGLLYCSLYLNAKLKIFTNYRPQYWKFVLFFTPILGAILMATSLTIDYYHHWYDIVAGSTIGIFFALTSYRYQYASIWDYHFNHIPLPRLQADLVGYNYHLAHLQSSMSASCKGGWSGLHIQNTSLDMTRL